MTTPASRKERAPRRHWRELHDQCAAKMIYNGMRTLADFKPRTVARLIRNGRKRK